MSSGYYNGNVRRGLTRYSLTRKSFDIVSREIMVGALIAYLRTESFALGIITMLIGFGLLASNLKKYFILLISIFWGVFGCYVGWCTAEQGDTPIILATLIGGLAFGFSWIIHEEAGLFINDLE